MNIFISISSLRLYFFNLFTEISASLSKGDSVNPVEFFINTKWRLSRPGSLKIHCVAANTGTGGVSGPTCWGSVVTVRIWTGMGHFLVGCHVMLPFFVRACAARSVVIFCGATVGAENF
jgi:hypothetical protein